MNNKIIKTAILLGMIAIILGAFGAHALKKVLSVEQLATFETGIKYQMYHALFLLFLGLNDNMAEKAKKTIYWLTLLGVVFFSGSIYLLSTMSLTNINFKPIGIITPIGGTMLILAWALLFLQFVKKK